MQEVAKTSEGFREKNNELLGDVHLGSTAHHDTSQLQVFPGERSPQLKKNPIVDSKIHLPLWISSLNRDEKDKTHPSVMTIWQE